MTCQCDGGKARATYHLHPIAQPERCSAQGAPEHRGEYLLVPPFATRGVVRCRAHSPAAPIVRSLYDRDLEALIGG